MECYHNSSLLDTSKSITVVFISGRVKPKLVKKAASAGFSIYTPHLFPKQFTTFRPSFNFLSLITHPIFTSCGIYHNANLHIFRRIPSHDKNCRISPLSPPVYSPWLLFPRVEKLCASINASAGKSCMFFLSADTLLHRHLDAFFPSANKLPNK